MALLLWLETKLQNKTEHPVVSMNILMVDTDQTFFPNLALMKLSAWHKKNGDKVWLDLPNGHIDCVYIACVFDWNKETAVGLAKAWRSKGIPVKLGGFPLNKHTLPDEIEHIMPDYGLYGVDFSVGFASRGCFRNCEFCIVTEKEGNQVVFNASIHEFLHPDHQKLFLLDNNILASPKWKFTFEEILETDVLIDFNQGLDMRILNQAQAELLGQMRFLKNLKIAFDRAEMKDEFVKSVNLLTDNGVKVHKLQCYTLVGYNTSFEEDMERLRVMKELGVKCYPTFYKPPNGRPEGVKETGDLDVFMDSLPTISPIGADMLGRHYGFIKGDERLPFK